MNKYSEVKWFKPAFLIFLIAMTFAAKAQTNLDGRPRRQPRVTSDNELGERPMGGSAGRFMPGIERLQAVLTEEQRGSLRESMEGQRGKVRELEEKLRAVRREIFEAGLTGNFDEAAVSQKAGVAAKLDADITVLRARAFSQMRPRLTAEQIEKLKNLPLMGPGEIPRDRPGKALSGPRDENDLPVKGN